MIKIAVVEDEKKEAQKLKQYLHLFLEQEKAAGEIVCFTGAEEFLEQSSGYHLVFMDIELPGMNGMDACRKLRTFDQDIIIVFTTNLVRYAVEGYEVNAVDFMVKPIQYPDFLMKMQKVMVQLNRRRDKKLELRSTAGVYFVKVSEIDYVEVMRHYLIYHAGEKTYRVRGVMKRTEEELQPYGFSRCSKSFLVNMNCIRAVEGNLITVENQKEFLPIGRTHRDSFLADFTDFLGEI